MSDATRTEFPARALALALLAWALPTAGHLALGRRGRAAIFFVVIATAVATGALLDGNLLVPVPGQPLSTLLALGAMGLGAPYFTLRFALGYRGAPESAGFEYGTIFLLSAGLMNLMLVLDVWDIARGRKE